MKRASPSSTSPGSMVTATAAGAVVACVLIQECEPGFALAVGVLLGVLYLGGVLWLTGGLRR